MSVRRAFDGSEPLGPVGRLAGIEEERRAVRSSRIASGTLACEECDAPVAPARALSPAEWIACPYCGHAGPVHEFLSLSVPTRPARVEVRVVHRSRRALR